MPISVLFGRSRVAAGLRDKLVQIEQNTPGVSPGGMPREVWTPLGKPVLMNRNDTLADERFSASQESAYGVTQWHMAYQPSMDPERIDVTRLRRLNANGRIYNIRSASLMERRTGIELVTLAKTD